MTTRLAVLGLVLLMLAGCWSKGPETVPEPKSDASQAQPAASSPASADRSLTREIKSGDYRLTIDLASQVLRLNIEKPITPRAEGTIQADDSVTIVPATADVRVEDRVVAQVKAGQVLAVSQVQGDFVGVSLLVGGKPVSGWLRRQEVAFKTAESKLKPTLADIGKSDMVPAAMLVQKAKAFEDGLYAAVELAAQEGAGTFGGKHSMLSALVASVLQPPLVAEKSPIVLLAGAKLGGVVEHLPPALEPEVATAMASFEGDAARSLPISFYTWSPELERIFQQDRMLQTPLEAGEAETLVAALGRDTASIASYETYLELVSRLTNPPAKPDLRSMLAGAAAAPGRDEICFFPPSRAFEGDLFRRLIGPGPVPDDFSLMNELVAQVRSGKLSLTPTAASGWYDYTAWALEPMIVPDKAAEAEHLELSDSYREHLTDLFKGSLALARETHVAPAAPPAPMAAPAAREAGPKFFLQPELSAEPLATSYLRRAQGYRFVAGALESAFGRQALEKMHRLTQAGPVTMNLAEELAAMEDLFLGAAAVVGRQLGMEKILPDELEGRAEPGERAFRDWSADSRKDADLAGDLRMMVPVYRENNRIKVWVLLGWTEQTCQISFANEPKAMATDAAGKPLEAGTYEIHLNSAWQTLATPVVAEVYVTQLLNRDEFRKHCDTYWTPAAILANLK